MVVDADCVVLLVDNTVVLLVVVCAVLAAHAAPLKMKPTEAAISSAFSAVWDMFVFIFLLLWSIGLVGKVCNFIHTFNASEVLPAHAIAV